MNIFQIGDIVVGNSSWLNNMIGYGGGPGVLICVGQHSSIIHLFTIKQDITLMNEYIDKLDLTGGEKDLKIGDLVILKPKITKYLRISGAGTIISKTIIRTNDFEGKWTNDKIDAFLVYFTEMGCEYTIPCSCLELFSKTKND